MQLTQEDSQDGGRAAQDGLLRLWASIVIPFIQDAEAGVNEAAMTEVRRRPTAS